MFEHIDITSLPISPHPSPLLQGEGAWRIEFGLWLRNTPSRKHKHRANSTMVDYQRDMNLMAAWFESQYGVAFDPCHMNEQNLGQYFAQFENAPATHKRKRASLKLFIRWAMNASVIDYDPSGWISTIDVVKKSPRDLNDGERIKLEAAAEAGETSLLGLRDSIIFFLMDDGGLRISEAANLKLTDLDLNAGMIRNMVGKGNKVRDVYLTPRLVNKIRLWLDRKPDSVEGTLVTDEHGLAICRQTAWTRFVLLREAAGVNATPHSMRHTYIYRLKHAYKTLFPFITEDEISASASYQTGDDVEVIRAYYTGVRESNLRAAVEAM